MLDWSQWDWGASLARYSGEVRVVLFDLLRLLGMMGGAVPATVTRSRRLEVLAVLRPLEAAVRRVIVMAARGVSAPAPVRRAPPAKPIPRGDGSSDRPPPFPLFDPRIQPVPRRRTVPKAREPRVWFFDGCDPPRPVRPAAPSPDDRVDASALTGRLLSLKAALGTIPKQARRMARAVARRAAAGRKVVRPVRPARPPGHRHRGRRPVDVLLAETHDLACIALREARPPP